MASEWKQVVVDDVCNVGDGAHAKVKRQVNGVMYLTSKNIGDGFIKLNDVNYISETDYKRLFSSNSKATRRPQAGDLLMGIIGTFGTAYLYKESDFFGVSSAVALLRPKTNLIHPKFLYYVATSYNFKATHGAFKSGSVQGYTNIPTIKRLPIPLPPLETQRQIASILSAFDDKIELNRRMNRTLEAMARALFKSWFVDFEPVRAKMRGEAPLGMDAETAALFPDALLGVDGREAPMGWEVKPISSLCNVVQNGSTPRRLHDDFWVNGSINWFKTGELTESFLFESEEKITEAGLKGSSAKLWPAGTVLIAIYAAPTVGRLGILTQPSTSNQACSALIPKPEVGSYYLWHTLFEAREWLNTISVGAAQQNISKTVVENVPALVPSPEILKIFNREITYFWEAQKSCQLESAHLEQLRDALLPRLLSGELDVESWEEKV